MTDKRKLFWKVLPACTASMEKKR